MQVKFTIDYDLIELVDAIGLDYEINNDIEITIDEAEYHLGDAECINLTDDELCKNLLNEELIEGLIYTERVFDGTEEFKIRD
tara:strand:- start:11 stop:259 length:249 start_codon:yes stop_codon:yes gene_type:complete